MTTNAKTNHANADDLPATLKIDRSKKRSIDRGRWVSGTIADHSFQALVFPEHAASESFELGQSRISKLWVRCDADKFLVANFDRGWDVRPTDATGQAIVATIASALATKVFGAE